MPAIEIPFDGPDCATEPRRIGGKTHVLRVMRRQASPERQPTG
jgi:hypothetical protein